MQKQITQLFDFHEAFDHHRPGHPTLDAYPFELRIRLVVEEALEFADACGYAVTARTLGNGALRPSDRVRVKATRREEAEGYAEPNWPEMIDGLIDQLYVVLGAFTSMGFTGDQVVAFFEEVHRSNMAKRGGGKDQYGKSLKPKGWTPPRIEEMLKAIVDGVR